MAQLKSTATILTVAMLGTLALAGCATKKFVRAEAGAVDTKLTATQSQVQDAQGALQVQGGRIADLDRTSKEALDRAVAAGKLAEGKFLYAVVLSDDSVKFPLDRSALSPEAETRLSALIEQLRADNKNVYLEIQGHTDATGTPAYNNQLGQDRAGAVRLFLNQHGIALNRMSTISYGETAPVVPNTTREGRAQNRRVAIVVLS